MDLGATCCTRSQPAREQCPLGRGVAQRAQKRQTDFPAENLVNKFHCGSAGSPWSRTPGEVLLQKRPNSGIWGASGTTGVRGSIAAKAWIANTLSLPAERCRIDALFHHTFTHFKLEVIR